MADVYRGDCLPPSMRGSEEGKACLEGVNDTVQVVALLLQG